MSPLSAHSPFTLWVEPTNQLTNEHKRKPTNHNKHAAKGVSRREERLRCLQTRDADPHSQEAHSIRHTRADNRQQPHRTEDLHIATAHRTLNTERKHADTDTDTQTHQSDTDGTNEQTNERRIEQRRPDGRQTDSRQTHSRQTDHLTTSGRK